jgi:hypothetical protein
VELIQVNNVDCLLKRGGIFVHFTDHPCNHHWIIIVGFLFIRFDVIGVVVNFVNGNVLPLGEKSFGEFLYFLGGHSVGTSLSFDLFPKQFSQISENVGRVNVFLDFEFVFCRLLALVLDLLAFCKIFIVINWVLVAS